MSSQINKTHLRELATDNCFRLAQSYINFSKFNNDLERLRVLSINRRMPTTKTKMMTAGKSRRNECCPHCVRPEAEEKHIAECFVRALAGRYALNWHHNGWLVILQKSSAFA